MAQLLVAPISTITTKTMKTENLIFRSELLNEAVLNSCISNRNCLDSASISWRVGLGLAGLLTGGTAMHSE